MRENARPFVVMAKPVGSRCNMRCAYCYYLEKGQYSSHARQSRMSFDLLERLIRQTMSGMQGSVVSFVWHGGEPTLAGLDFFEKAVELEKRYMPRGVQVWNNLQTNGILINDAWCRFLKENRFDVGVSIDGCEAVHDQNRRTRGGEGTFGRALRAVERLRAFGVEPDLLCTVNSASCRDPLAVYRGLRETGSTWAQFIPIVVRGTDGSLSPESVTGEMYGEFLCAVFDEWVKNDLGKLDVQLFAETARILAGGEASVCWMSRTCGRVLIAEEDGGIYACDHFVDDAHRLGNLQTMRIDAAAQSEAQLSFGDAKETTLTAQCRACPHLRFCGGGCLKDRFGLSRDGEKGQYALCAGLERFFSHAVPVLERVMALSAKGKTPDEIMKSL